jgi:hypothetical protein
MNVLIVAVLSLALLGAVPVQVPHAQAPPTPLTIDSCLPSGIGPDVIHAPMESATPGLVPGVGSDPEVLILAVYRLNGKRIQIGWHASSPNTATAAYYDPDLDDPGVPTQVNRQLFTDDMKLRYAAKGPCEWRIVVPEKPESDSKT